MYTWDCGLHQQYNQDDINYIMTHETAMHASERRARESQAHVQAKLEPSMLPWVPPLLTPAGHTSHMQHTVAVPSAATSEACSLSSLPCGSRENSLPRDTPLWERLHAGGQFA